MSDDIAFSGISGVWTLYSLGSCSYLHWSTGTKKNVFFSSYREPSKRFYDEF